MLRKLICIMLGISFMQIMSMPVRAEEWIKDQVGWWYRYDDGTYPYSQWFEDGSESPYYFDARGYLAEYNEAGKYVKTAKEEHFQWKDGVGNNWDIRFKRPEITINADWAKEINAEISLCLEDRISDTKRSCKGKASPYCAGNEYYSWMYRKILFLVIHIKNDYGMDEFKIFRVHVDTGERISNDTLCHMNHISRSRLDMGIQDLFEKEFSEENYQSAKQAGWGDFFAEQRNKTLAWENIEDSVLLLREDGSAAVICRIYSLAGGDSYLRFKNLGKLY
ncbi:MAG: hypothetical protein Q4A19_02285 [Johnsonella sp.]|nr:hypothetical protein [Johnsonella sp.]